MADKANRYIVGAIGVKVRPYTEGFHADLKVQLKKEQEKIRPLLVEIDPDTKGLLREVNRSVDAVNAVVDDVKVDVSLDQSELARDVAQAKRHLDSLEDKRVRVDALVDEHGLRQLQRQVQALDRFNEATREHVHAAEQVAEAQRHLQREVRALHDWLNRPINWTSALLDPTEGNKRKEFDQRIADAMDGLNRWQAKVEETERALGRLFNEDAELALRLDEESLERARRQIDDFRDYLDPKRTIEMRVEPNLRSIREAQRQIDRMLGEDGAFNFKVSADPEDLRRLRQHLEEIKEDYNNTEIDFEPTIDGLNSRFVAMRLAFLARDRWVTFRPILDSRAMSAVATSLAALSGLRMLESTFENIWDWVKNLDKNIPLIAGVTLAVMGLTASILSSTSNLLAFSRSLAQIGGAALALPGIMGGFAVGIGTTVAVLKDFNEVLPGVRRELSDLQDQLSLQFWRRARVPMQRAFDSLLVPFREGVLETADALGFWFAEASNAMARYVGRSMPEMFENLNLSIRVSAMGMGDLAQVIEILGKRGSEYLPRLADWANRNTRSFREWLDEADRTGRLTHFIELGLEQLHQLGRVLRHTGGILTDLAIAAEKAGGSSLKAVADQLEDIHRVTGSEKFQDGMVRTFQSAHEAMRRIAEVSGPRVSHFFENLSYLFERGMPIIGDAIGRLLGGLAEAFSTDRFSAGFMEMLEGIRRGVQSLDPVWKQVGDGLGALGEVIGDLARFFGPLLAEALRLAGAAAERLQPSLSRIIESLSGRLLSVLERLGPIVLDIAEAFLRLVEPLVRMPGVIEAVAVAFGAWRVAAWAAGLSKAAGAIAALRNSFVGLPDLVRRSEGAFAGLVRRLGPGGLATVAVAAATAIQHMVKSIRDAEFTRALDMFDTGRLIHDLQGVSDASWESSGAVRDLVAEIYELAYGIRTDNIRDLAVNLEGVSSLMQNLTADARRFGEGWLGAITKVTGTSSHVENLAAATRRWDEVLTGLIESGNIDDAVALHDALAQGMQRGGATARQIAEAFPEYNYLLEQNAEAAAQAAYEQQLLNAEKLGLARGTLLASENMRVYEDAIARVNGVTPALIGAIDETARSFVDLAQGLDAENFSLDGWLDQLEQQVRDMQMWADNMAIIAQQGNEAVTRALMELGPAGATAVAELAAELEAGGTDSFDRLAAVVEMGSNGVLEGVDGKFGQLAGTVEGHLMAAELAVAMGMSDMAGTSALGGQNVIEQLSEGMLVASPEIRAAMAVVKAAVEGDLEALQLLASPAGAELIELLAGGMDSGTGLLRTTSNGLSREVIEGLRSWHKDATGLGADGVQGFVDGLQSGKGGVASAASEIAETVPIYVADGLEMRSPSRRMRRLGVFAAEGLTLGLRSSVNAVRSAAKSMVDAMLSAWSRVNRDAASAGKSAGVGFTNGLSGYQSRSRSAALSLGSSAVDGARAVQARMLNAGAYVASGFVKGVNARWGAAYSAGVRLGNAANAGARSALRIMSPSRVMMEVGRFTGEGMVAGINDMQGKVEAAGARLAEAAARGAAGRNLRVESEMAVRDAQGQTGRFQGATVNLTVHNPVERSTSQELNSGLQTLDVLVS